MIAGGSETTLSHVSISALARVGALSKETKPDEKSDNEVLFDTEESEDREGNLST